MLLLLHADHGEAAQPGLGADLTSSAAHNVSNPSRSLCVSRSAPQIRVWGNLYFGKGAAAASAKMGRDLIDRHCTRWT